MNIEKKETAKFYKQQRHYKKVVKRLAGQFKKRGVIKVAFVVVFNSVFPTRPIFEHMLTDNAFDPYIIVVPNVSQNYKNLYDVFNEAYEKLSEQYGDRVIPAYDCDSDEYLDLKDEYGIMFFANPYKYLVNPLHHVEYFLNKNVLPIYSSYGFAALKFWDEVMGTDFYNYMWKSCVETPLNLKYLCEHEKIKGKNGLITGYIKMDKYASVEKTPSDRKKILICPHHTVWGWKNLNISNFLKYAELFVELPKIFPQVDFIFRPHPLLLTNLRTHNIWTTREIEEYLNRLLSSPNIVHDTSGDYMQQFVDSDAMIHDCGSFIGEYLYTEKPCLYMMKSLETTMEGLVPLGQECMKRYYHAFNKEDIINFINNVVLNGDDPMKEDRVNFVQNELKVNYPNAAKFICEVIKKELKIIK